jgi:hypothetical protein
MHRLSIHSNPVFFFFAHNHAYSPSLPTLTSIIFLIINHTNTHKKKKKKKKDNNLSVPSSNIRNMAVLRHNMP